MAYHVLEMFWRRFYRPVMREVDPRYFDHFTQLLEAFRAAGALDDRLEVESEAEALAGATYLWQQLKQEFPPELRRRVDEAERRITRGEVA